MGFPCIAVGLPKSLVALLHLLNYTKHVVAQVFFYTGAFDPSSSSSSSEAAYALPPEFYSSQAPVASPSSIKSRLPVVEFADFSKGSCCCDQKDYNDQEEEHHQQPLCAVCLIELEASHEVRELGNCSHAFHMGCIDKWVDIGNVTCPLCRAPILPKGPIGGMDLTIFFRW